MADNHRRRRRARRRWGTCTRRLTWTEAKVRLLSLCSCAHFTFLSSARALQELSSWCTFAPLGPDQRVPETAIVLTESSSFVASYSIAVRLSWQPASDARRRVRVGCSNFGLIHNMFFLTALLATALSVTGYEHVTPPTFQLVVSLTSFDTRNLSSWSGGSGQPQQIPSGQSHPFEARYFDEEHEQILLEPVHLAPVIHKTI